MPIKSTMVDVAYDTVGNLLGDQKSTHGLALMSAYTVDTIRYACAFLELQV